MFDYVLRFQLPTALAFAIAPGPHGFGITVGYNDVVFVRNRSPRICCDLTALFLIRINSAQLPMIIPAALLKFLPCPAHGQASTDIEAIHDDVQRNALARRDCVIAVGSSIVIRNAVPGELVYSIDPEPADH